jgi:hypothetical protein
MNTISETRRRPSMASMIVWVLLCFILWAWAIIMPLVFVLGAVQMLFQPPFLDMQLGATNEEQLRNLGTAAAQGAVGVAFVVLRLRGHLQFGDRD